MALAEGFQERFSDHAEIPAFLAVLNGVNQVVWSSGWSAQNQPQGVEASLRSPQMGVPPKPAWGFLPVPRKAMVSRPCELVDTAIISGELAPLVS